MLLIEAAPPDPADKPEETGLVWVYLPLNTSHCQKYITRAKTGVTLLWNQIKQCFVAIYVLHLSKPNWNQTFLSSLPLPEYIVGAKFSTSLVTAPDRLEVTATNSLTFSPGHMCETLSKQPNSGPKATAAGLLPFVVVVSGKNHCLLHLVSLNASLLAQPLPPATPLMQFGLHFRAQSPTDTCWVSEAKLCSALSMGKRVELLCSVSYRAVTSCSAMPIA